MRLTRHLITALLTLLLALPAAHAEEDEAEPPAAPLASLTVEVPNGFISLLEDLQELRLEKREYLLEFELKGRESLRSRIERVDDELAEKLKEFDEELLQELRSYRRDLERTNKKIDRLQEQLQELDEQDEKRADELFQQIQALKQENVAPEQILDAFEDLYSDARDAVKGLGSRIDGLFANTGADMPHLLITTPDRKPWDLRDVTDKQDALLVFWSPRNDDSVKGLELVHSQQRDLDQLGALIVPVAVATTPEQLSKAAADLPADLPLYLIDQAEAKDKRITLLPMIAYVERGGRLHSVFVGYTTKLRSIIDDIIEDRERYREAKQD